MCKGILAKILSTPIENLQITKKRLPNIEVLRLYREVLKFTGEFYWNNQKGECWRDILRKSARREFDLSKQETDNIHVMKMMVTTRQSMEQIRERLFANHAKLTQTVEETRNN